MTAYYNELDPQEWDDCAVTAMQSLRPSRKRSSKQRRDGK